MDASAADPHTPSYSRDPAAAAAAANPSTGSFGNASAGAPPSTLVARGLFMPPRMTSSAGGGAPAPAMKPRAHLPNAARLKKKKAADGSGSSKPSRKKLVAGCAAGAAATEAPASSLVEPAADVDKVFEEMPQSVNDDAYMSTMGVGSNNWSQTDDHEFEVDEDGEGIVDAPKGRAGNYTNEEDILICNTWLQVSRDPSVGGDQSRDAYWRRMKEYFDLHNKSGIDRTDRSLRSRWSTINKDCQMWAAAQKAVDKLNPSGTNEDDRLNIAQNLFKGEGKKSKKGKITKGRTFTLAHCYDVLKDDEKWKKREDMDDLNLGKKRKRTIDLEDDEEEASSDDGKRSPTPNSVSYSKPKRPDGTKKDAKEKKKKKEDDGLKNAMDAIVKARKEANEARKMARSLDAAAEERRLAAEERRVTAEERKVALEERKVALEERSRLLEWEKHLFFMDTSTLNEAQKEYVNLARQEVLIQKRASMGGGGLGGMGGGGLGGMGGAGLGGMGGGGFGATMGGMGSMGGFGATMETMGGMGGFGVPPGGMSFASLIGGMGAPPGGMGGMSSGVPHHTPPHVDAARDNEEKEEASTSEDETEEEEDEDDEDEDEV